MAFGSFYPGKKILLTGDTGFKGAWLAEWLSLLGAEVHGLGLEPETTPSLFEILALRQRIHHTTLDIRDEKALARHVADVRPDVVFHLAAQAIVRRSYEIPLETLQTNVLGTANLLWAVQQAGYDPEHPCAIVVITSDKCYENQETCYAYRETDPMGGHDIYSSSKGMAELAASSWRRSFFAPPGAPPTGLFLATCRAGNVIGGGDWARDRIVVDSIRALSRNEEIEVRNPLSIRPWQHVLEPLSGYLTLGALLHRDGARNPSLASAWNFGPGREAEKTVGELCDQIVRRWAAGGWHHKKEFQPVHEARFLKLAVDKAWHALGWKPAWDFSGTIEATVSWYRKAFDTDYDHDRMIETTRSQIQQYCADAADQSIRWAVS